MAASTSAGAQDPLDLIRSALRSTASSQSDPFTAIQLIDGQSAPTTSILQATSIKIGDVTLDKSTTTRLARSRDDLASRLTAGNPPNPASEPSFFYNVEAVILAVQLRDERPGAYLAQAATAKVASFPTLDRTAILDYLFGKRAEWAGVLKAGDLTAAGAGESAPTASSADIAATTDAHGVKRPYKVNTKTSTT